MQTAEEKLLHAASKIEALEKRLNNTEKALIGFFAMMEDTLPPASQDGINAMIVDYAEANEGLGASLDTVEFHTKPL